MPVLRLAVAACALLLLTACGAGTTTRGTGEAARIPTVASDETDQRATDTTKSIADDVTLTVQSPRSFTPTATAYPPAARAVAFEMLIDNQSDSIYRPAQLSFVATADGISAAQVVDSTQGYTGVVGAIDEVLPNQTLRFAIAFGVPERPSLVRVAVRPTSASANAIPIFHGTV